MEMLVNLERLKGGLEAVLSDGRYSEKSQKSFWYMMRRVERELDGNDLADPYVILQYRWQLTGSGTLNIFDSLWKLLLLTDEGVSLARILRKPIVTIPHPLYADLMLLGATFGNERLVEMTWKDLSEDYRTCEPVWQAAMRVFKWFAFPDVRPRLETPAVIKDMELAPMKLWQLSGLINTADAYRDRLGRYSEAKIAELENRMIAVAVVHDVNTTTLSKLYERIIGIGREAKDLNHRPFVKRIEEAKSLDELEAIVYSLPKEPGPTFTLVGPDEAVGA